MNDLARNDLVAGLPKFKYHKEHLCPSCEQGKSKRASHPPKPVPNLRQRLHLLHMDLCGPIRISSINVERKNRTLVEAARTMLIFSRAPLFLWAEVIATACFTQKRSIIHRRFNKTPYELINGKKPDISFLHVFGALCYPKNDREDIRKLGAKAMAFEQRNSKPGLQSMTSGQISSGLDLTYAPSTITTQQPTKETVPTPTNSSSHATNFLIFSQDVDELNSQQQHVQQQGNQAHLQSITVADNVSNAMFDANTFVNPFVNSSISLPKFKDHKEHLCPSCEQGKSKRASYPPKPVPNLRQRLHLLHMDLCGPIRIASINGKRSKDEAPEVIKTILKRITILL
nr:integrase, catalytic region, zinc finger, CCHC-type, peptidase aspartic, catalytic [Tanacetum cinerariifolium]